MHPQLVKKRTKVAHQQIASASNFLAERISDDVLPEIDLAIPKKIRGSVTLTAVKELEDVELIAYNFTNLAAIIHHIPDDALEAALREAFPSEGPWPDHAATFRNQHVPDVHAGVVEAFQVAETNLRASFKEEDIEAPADLLLQPIPEIGAWDIDTKKAIRTAIDANMDKLRGIAWHHEEPKIRAAGGAVLNELSSAVGRIRGVL